MSGGPESAPARQEGEQTTEYLLENILRGAARLVGCNSTNLVVMDDRRGTIRVKVGVTEIDYPVLGEMEGMMGMSFRGINARLEDAAGGLLHQVWKEGRPQETGSIREMVGNAIDAEVVEQFESLIGPHRYILVPAEGQRRRFGVLVFEKGGTNPFSRQQRTVLGRYARRIGAILEQGLRSLPRLEDLLEEGLEPLEAMLLRLTVSEPAPALFLDPRLRITSCNEALGGLLGRQSAEMEGTGLGQLFLDPQPLVRMLNQQASYPHSWLQEVDAVVRRADGSLLGTSVEALLLADEQQRAVGFLLLLRPQPESGRRPVDPHLQERLATVGEMAAQLAHEVRNPLVAIGATIERLAADLADSRHRSTLQRVLGEIARLDHILKKFLAPGSRLAREPVRLAELVDEVARMVQGGRNDGQVVNRVEADLVVEADQDALKQLLFNLIMNAREAAGSDGRVVCRGRRQGCEVWLAVDDSGPGLAEEPERCFEPFFTTKRNGTGLGLAVCRKIVESHRGTIRLASRPEGGCRAEVFLPAGPAH